jgi:hypothetical protein
MRRPLVPCGASLTVWRWVSRGTGLVAPDHDSDGVDLGEGLGPPGHGGHGDQGGAGEGKDDDRNRSARPADWATRSIRPGEHPTLSLRPPDPGDALVQAAAPRRPCLPETLGSIPACPTVPDISPHQCPHCFHCLGRIRPLTWSPLTESNRRPSPYHGARPAVLDVLPEPTRADPATLPGAHRALRLVLPSAKAMGSVGGCR